VSRAYYTQQVLQECEMNRRYFRTRWHGGEGTQEALWKLKRRSILLHRH
jgi:hypothetical protein